MVGQMPIPQSLNGWANAHTVNQSLQSVKYIVDTCNFVLVKARYVSDFEYHLFDESDLCINLNKYIGIEYKT